MQEQKSLPLALFLWRLAKTERHVVLAGKTLKCFFFFSGLWHEKQEVVPLAGVSSGRSAHRRRQQPPNQKTPASARVIISRANLCQIEKTSPQPGDFFFTPAFSSPWQPFAPFYCRIRDFILPVIKALA